MNRLCYYTILFLLTFSQYEAYGQADCITAPPLPPLLTSVTVQPLTGNTIINWSPSPSQDLAAYIVYSIKENGDALALDTIWNTAVNTCTLTTTASKYFSVSYVVAAMRLPRCTSILSNQLNTIFNEVKTDTCNKKILIKWNKYADSPGKVLNYKIALSVDGGPYSEPYTTDRETVNYSISDFETDVRYCFYITAFLDNGTFSSSNLVCVTTTMQRPPEWINADQTTVTEDAKISLSFTYDPLSETDLFRLERSDDAGGIFSQIASLTSSNGKIEYTDSNTDIKKVHFYRLSAINNCNIPVTLSNISSNIVLSLEKRNDQIKLSWNGYRKWNGELSEYRLLIDTGNGYYEKSGVDPADTLYMLNYNEIMYEIVSSEVCFKIEALEKLNPYGVQGLSRSSVVCLSPEEIITVPNIFTPNNDMLNDTFRPVLSFTPILYRFLISDRGGIVLFESTDYLQAWDGSADGNIQPQGVYLWFLKLTTPSGKTITRTGTVTVYLNQK